MNPDISIVLTIHNKQELLEDVLKSIWYNVSNRVGEIICVLDGCTDYSERILNYFIDRYKNEGYDFFLNDNVKILKANNVFETRANNLGLSAVKKESKYAIIVQDDCIIQEELFDLRLIKPMIAFDDIWAVSGRNAHNVLFSLQIYPYILDYPNLTGLGTSLNKRNKFYIRSVVNRGPLCLDMDIMRETGFFSEEIWKQNGDDHLKCLDVYKSHGKKVGSYAIRFLSKDEWGSTRKPEASTWINEAIIRNQNLIFSKHRDILTNQNLWWNEERELE